MEFTQVLENFDNKLFAEFLKTKRNQNIIFSPFCIQTCLAMARMGAEGQTATEMDKGFGLTTRNPDEHEMAENYHSILEELNEYSDNLTIANKIYVNQEYKIQPAFNKLMTGQFFSSIESINFNDKEEAAKTINDWIKATTNNLITDIVQASEFKTNSPFKTGLILINAIHFKGIWELPFPEHGTREEDFYVTRTKTVKVQMMHRHSVEHFKYGEFQELKATALEMPYKRSDLSMIIILPNTRSGLSALEKQLKYVSIQDLKKRMYFSEVIVSVPKFKAEFEVELTDVLQKIGMKRMFTDNAEFNKKMLKLKQGEWIKISKVIHKAFINVNEKGTEAAAAARIVAVGGGGPAPKIPEFTANRPFYYVIQNANGVVLFKGHVRKF